MPKLTSCGRYIAIINVFQKFDFVKLENPQKIVTVPKKFNSPIDKWIEAVEIAGNGCAITYETEPKNQMKNCSCITHQKAVPDKSISLVFLHATIIFFKIWHALALNWLKNHHICFSSEQFNGPVPHTPAWFHRRKWEPPESWALWRGWLWCHLPRFSRPDAGWSSTFIECCF